MEKIQCLRCGWCCGFSWNNKTRTACCHLIPPEISIENGVKKIKLAQCKIYDKRPLLCKKWQGKSIKIGKTKVCEEGYYQWRKILSTEEIKKFFDLKKP